MYIPGAFFFKKQCGVSMFRGTRVGGVLIFKRITVGGVLFIRATGVSPLYMVLKKMRWEFENKYVITPPNIVLIKY